MKFKISTIDELNSRELIEILEQRVKVFVVEQNCPYQEVDDDDLNALHIELLDDEGNLCGYSRVYKTDGHVTFGRVLVPKERRRHGYANELLQKTLSVIEERYPGQRIEIEAQVYLTKFYESFGFKQISDVFLLDGIPHCRMEK